MRTAAIIAEYNPFHSGHALHVERTRRQYGATHIVAIMSGCFVQRGEPAICGKRERVLMALRGGVDLVLELPLPWAMAGAERFARGGVSLAAALGCADMLSFGSECGQIDRLRAAAEYIDTDEARGRLRQALGGGVTYAAARAAAGEEHAAVFSRPNDLLGVEYCRAGRLLAPGLELVTVRREGAAHDAPIAAETASAAAIRSFLREGSDAWRAHMPAPCAGVLEAALRERSAPTDISRLDRALLCRLRGMTAGELARLPDVSEGLENRIAAAAAACAGERAGFEELCGAIKCKRYTHARIRRVVLSALLGMTASEGAGLPPYLRVLGMNGRGRELLGAMRPTLPVITRYAQAQELDERGRAVFAREALAADIFALTLPSAGRSGSEQEYRLVTLED